MIQSILSTVVDLITMAALSCPSKSCKVFSLRATTLSMRDIARLRFNVKTKPCWAVWNKLRRSSKPLRGSSVYRNRQSLQILDSSQSWWAQLSRPTWSEPSITRLRIEGEPSRILIEKTIGYSRSYESRPVTCRPTQPWKLIMIRARLCRGKSLRLRKTPWES